MALDIPAPDIDFVGGCEQFVRQHFPSFPQKERLARFISLGVTHRAELHRAENRLLQWQHGCLDSLGTAYYTLLVSHIALLRNPEITSEQLNDFSRAKTAVCEAAETALELSKLTKHSEGSREKLIRATHFRFIGALAAVLSYDDLRTFFDKFYFCTSLSSNAPTVSYKTLFQEYVQGSNHSTPTYKLISETGADHAKVFQVQASALAKTSANVCGATKKKAEEGAAEKWLRTFARSWIEQRLLQATRTQSLRPKATALPFELDSNTRNVIQRFALHGANEEMVQRAITHPSYGYARGLPIRTDNRALAVFGSIVATASVALRLFRESFTDAKFSDAETSFALVQAASISCEALEPFVLKSGLLKSVRMGGCTTVNELNPNQRVAFLEAIFAVRFLSAPAHPTPETYLGTEIAQRIQDRIKGAECALGLKTPITKFAELIGMHRLTIVALAPIFHEGTPTFPIFVGRFEIRDQNSSKTLIIRGGRGSTDKAARTELAKILHRAVTLIHSDFAEAKAFLKGDLLDRMSALLLPAALSRIFPAVNRRHRSGGQPAY